MLVLTRKKEQSIIIGDNVEIMVLGVSGDKVRLGITAPREVDVFRKEVIAGMTIHANSFNFEPEFTAKILKRKYRIFEVPITFNPRDYSQGKKIKLHDAFEAVWALIKYRFVD